MAFSVIESQLAMLHSTFFCLGKDLRLRFLRLLALLTLGSVVPLFGQVVIDGDFSDWSSLGQSSSNEVLEVEDDADLGDSSGDVAKISATTDGTNLILTMEYCMTNGMMVDYMTEGLQ